LLSINYFFDNKTLRDTDIKKKTNAEIITLLAATHNQNDTQFNSKPEVVVAVASLTSKPVAEIFPVALWNSIYYYYLFI
jgi:hypothetical protein